MCVYECGLIKYYECIIILPPYCTLDVVFTDGVTL